MDRSCNDKEDTSSLSGLDALVLACEMFEKNEANSSDSSTSPRSARSSARLAAAAATTGNSPPPAARTEERLTGTSRKRSSLSGSTSCGKNKKVRTAATGKQEAHQQPAVGNNKKTSRYRGVSFYQRTGKWECYLWLNGKEEEEHRPYLEELATDIWVAPDRRRQRKRGKKNGKQIYIGASDDEKVSARIYDRAVLLIRNEKKKLNFPCSDYEHEKHLWEGLSPAEVIKMLRGMSRKSMEWQNEEFKEEAQKFKSHSRWKPKKSVYRGVYVPSDRPHKFVAILRINYQSVHLGTADSEAEAARLWDKAAYGLLGSQVSRNLVSDELLVRGTEEEPSTEWQNLDNKELREYVKRLVHGDQEQAQSHS